MTLSLAQGGNVALSQIHPGLRTAFVGLNWQIPAAAIAVEIDACVFALNADGVVRNDGDFIFYNQETGAGGAVERIADVASSAAHDRDGFVVALPDLAEAVQRLAFCLTLDTRKNGGEKTFGAANWVQARIVDQDDGQELAVYRSDGELSTETALIVAELYRFRDGWKFRAVGQGFAGGLRALATHFGVLIADSIPSVSNSESAGTLAPPEATLSLSKNFDETDATDSVKPRQRRSRQDILATQVEDIEIRYRQIQPLLKRAMQDNPNESQSRLLLDRILQDVMGYALGEIKSEQKIQGRTADYVLAPGGIETLVIEAKRLGAPLRDKQIFQATSYAAYAGIRWALLTNVLNWQLYRVSAEDKVEADLVFSIDLQQGLAEESAYRLFLLSKTGIVRYEQQIEKIWRKKIALSPESLFAALLNEDVLNKIRIVLMRERGCALTAQEIQEAVESLR